MPLDPRRRAMLRDMGIEVWRLRGATPSDSSVQAPQEAAAGSTVARADWETLERQVAACTACPLHEGRTQTVFGVGDRSADWLFVGEGPGADEDRQGEPFVGRAGRLLNRMLQALGLRRESVYIANVVKCRPPKNRDPEPAEMDCCEPFLSRQIALIQPRVIVALGRIAAQRLSHSQAPLSRMRGRVHAYEATGTPLVVTYHPAYLLRSSEDKAKAWQDLKLARQVAAGSLAPEPGGP